MSELSVWLKRAERWRDTDLSMVEYAAEIGCEAALLRVAVNAPEKLRAELKKRARNSRVKAGAFTREQRERGEAYERDWWSRCAPVKPLERGYWLKRRKAAAWRRLMASVRRTDFSISTRRDGAGVAS